MSRPLHAPIEDYIEEAYRLTFDVRPITRNGGRLDKDAPERED